jgi:hypothetical protein
LVDPLPGLLGGRLIGLLSVSKERFLRELVRKRFSVPDETRCGLLAPDRDGQDVVSEAHRDSRLL